LSLPQELVGSAGHDRHVLGSAAKNRGFVEHPMHRAADKAHERHGSRFRNGSIEQRLTVTIGDDGNASACRTMDVHRRGRPAAKDPVDRVPRHAAHNR
jgi:hypothetical protein